MNQRENLMLNLITQCTLTYMKKTELLNNEICLLFMHVARSMILKGQQTFDPIRSTGRRKCSWKNGAHYKSYIFQLIINRPI